MQPPQGQFNHQGPPMNQQLPGQGMNINLQGPSFNQAPENVEASERTPYSSEEIKAFIRKEPYTQTIQG